MNTKPQWIVGEKNEAEAIEAAHDVSMSEDPAVACSGRLMKEILPTLGAWLNAELERGTESKFITSAATDAAAGIIATAVANIVLRRGKSPGIDQVTKCIELAVTGYFSRAIAQTIKHVEERGIAP